MFTKLHRYDNDLQRKYSPSKVVAFVVVVVVVAVVHVAGAVDGSVVIHIIDRHASFRFVRHLTTEQPELL